LKASGSGEDSQNQRADGEGSSGKGAEQKSKPPPEPPKDYIHVRARRGQATDSHSLAERVILYIYVLQFVVASLIGLKFCHCLQSTRIFVSQDRLDNVLGKLMTFNIKFWWAGEKRKDK